MILNIDHANQVFNLILRAATLVSKFALVFFLAKFLLPAEVGVYGLLSVTIGYCLFVVGQEFYVYSMRELVTSTEFLRAGILRDQLVFYVFSYIVFFPVFIIIFVGNFLPWDTVLWFYLLLLLEHFAQEINRVLVALSCQLEASAVLFLRSGAWVVVLIPLLLNFNSLRGLNSVLISWSMGASFACVLGVFLIVSKIKVGHMPPINWVWIKNGLRVAFPMLIAALSTRALFTFDRYLVEVLGGLDVLGAYVLYTGIAGAVIAFLDAGVVVFFYPRLIASAQEKNFGKFKADMKSLRANVMIVIFFLTFFSFVGGYLVVGWIDNPVYKDRFHFLTILLAATFVFGLSHTSHMGLYAQKKDRVILSSQVASLVLFFVIVGILKDGLGVTAVPVSLFVAFSLMLLWKNLAYRKMYRELIACYNEKERG